MSAIEARLAALEARCAALEGRLAGGEGAVSSSGGKAVADDDELDGPYGDFAVKRDPKSWLDRGGESFAGCQASQCPSDYLRALASYFDWQADQDDKKGKMYTDKRTGKERPASGYNRGLAAKARGWARRNANIPKQSQKQIAPAATGTDDFGGASGGGDDSEIPF